MISLSIWEKENLGFLKKNFRKKGVPKRQSCSSTCNSQQSEVMDTIVRISQNIYVNTSLTNLHTLYTRLTKVWDISTDWLISWCLSTIILTKPFSYGSLVVTISSDFCWSIRINDYPLQLKDSCLLQFHQETVNSVDYVRNMMNACIVQNDY